MLKSLLLIIMCTVALPVLGEPSTKYEVATILEVLRHQSADESASAAGASYDVSIKVGGTIYVVLYADTIGTIR
jgi:hypothetical protein